MWLVCQPEVSYIKNASKIIERWFAPSGMFFEAKSVQMSEDTEIGEIKKQLVLGEKPFIRGKK